MIANMSRLLIAHAKKSEESVKLFWKVLNEEAKRLDTEWRDPSNGIFYSSICFLAIFIYFVSLHFYLAFQNISHFNRKLQVSHWRPAWTDHADGQGLGNESKCERYLPSRSASI